MEYKRLGDIATYINGYAFKPGDRGTVGLPIIRIQDLTGNGYELGFYNGEYPEKIEINDGDILISWSASLGVYVWNKGKALLNQHIFKVVFDKIYIDKQYFVYAVRHKLGEMANMTHGATMKHIIKKDFDATQIPYPVIEKQKQISSNLDRLSNIIELRHKQLNYLDTLIKARFIEMFGDPVADTMKWGQKPLKDFLKSIRYGTSTPPKFTDYGYAFIRATNIKAGRIVDDDMKFINQQEADRLEKCKLSGGEIIIVRSGVNAGDTCIITDKYIGQYAGYDMIIVLNEMLNPTFLNMLINTTYMERVVKPMTRRAAQPHLNAEQTQSFPIICVPRKLQDEFAEFVQQVDKSKVAVQKALDETQTLFDSLMQEYFG